MQCVRVYKNWNAKSIKHPIRCFIYGKTPPLKLKLRPCGEIIITAPITTTIAAATITIIVIVVVVVVVVITLQ